MTAAVQKRRRFAGLRKAEPEPEKPKQVSLRTLFAPILSQIVVFRRAGEKSSVPADRLRKGLQSMLSSADHEARSAGYADEAIEHARFSIVAFADETVGGSDWAYRDEWMARPLQQEEFGTTIAGNEFFERLESGQSKDPELAEIDFLILSLGFQGQYAGSPAELEKVRRRIYDRFPQDVVRSTGRLTPQAYDEDIQGLREINGGFGLWKWIVIGAVAVLVLGTYAVLQWRIGGAVSGYAESIERALRE